MNKSDLIASLSSRFTKLSDEDVKFAVDQLINGMFSALTRGQRIEIRGFGSFAIHYRKPRIGRNPKTGVLVDVPGKYVPHFKAGKLLLQNISMDKFR